MKKSKMDDIVDKLNLIALDMEDDAKTFDGQMFNGRTVARYMGCQGAAIAALAKIVLAVVYDVVKVED